MFTPLAAVGDKLRPWIALVVLRAQERDGRRSTSGRCAHGRLPVLDRAVRGRPAADRRDVGVGARAGRGRDGAAVPGRPRRAHDASSRRRRSAGCCARAGSRPAPTTSRASCRPSRPAARPGSATHPDTTLAPAWTAASDVPARAPRLPPLGVLHGRRRQLRARGAAPAARAGAGAGRARVVDASDPGRSAVADPSATALPLAGALRPRELDDRPVHRSGRRRLRAARERRARS